MKRRKKDSSTPSPKTQNGNIFYECKFTKDPGCQNVVDEEKRQLKELAIPYDRLAAFGGRFRFPLAFLQPEGSESPLVVRFNRLARPYLNRDNFAYGPSALWMAYGR